MGEKSVFPDSVRTMSVDAKLILSVAVMIFAAGGVYAVLQGAVHANTKDVATVIEKVEKIDEEIGEIEDRAADNTDALKDQASGLNWIGEAIQAIAEKQDVRLPPRPIVAE